MASKFSVGHAKVACEIYPMLSQIASNEVSISLTYQGLADRLNTLFETSSFNARSVSDYLNHLMRWCDVNDLPPLTVLVVNSQTRIPGTGLETITDPEIATKEVRDFNWSSIDAPTVESLKAAFHRYPTRKQP